MRLSSPAEGLSALSARVSCAHVPLIVVATSVGRGGENLEAVFVRAVEGNDRARGGRPLAPSGYKSEFMGCPHVAPESGVAFEFFIAIDVGAGEQLDSHTVDSRR